MKRVLLALLCACALLIARPALAQYAALDGMPLQPSFGAGIVYFTGDNEAGINVDQWYTTVSAQVEASDYMLSFFLGTDPQEGGFIYGAVADYLFNSNTGNMLEQATGSYWVGAGVAAVGFSDLFPNAADGGISQLDFGPHVGLGFEHSKLDIGVGAGYLLDSETLMLSGTVNFDLN